MIAVKIIIDLFIIVGAFFALAGALGVLKMPDTLCRMQASTCIPTLGVICVAIGAILYAACFRHSAGDAIKIAVIALMIVFTNPIGSHVIARGAYKADQSSKKELRLEVDDYGRDFNE